MFVFYGKYGPAEQIEYCYGEVVRITDRIGVAEKFLTKEYMLTLGYELLGEIKELSGLPTFLKNWKSGKISSEITTPLSEVQSGGGTDTPSPKADVAPLPNSDPMSHQLPDTEAGGKQWWE